MMVVNRISSKKKKKKRDCVCDDGERETLAARAARYSVMATPRWSVAWYLMQVT